MKNDIQSASLDRVPCQVCQHDIPLSEAVVSEATDYVVYFCGLECYERWLQIVPSGANQEIVMKCNASKPILSIIVAAIVVIAFVVAPSGWFERNAESKRLGARRVSDDGEPLA